MSSGVDDPRFCVGRAVAELLSAIAANSYFVRGDTLTANFSTVPSNRAELALGRLSYDAPIGIDGGRIGAWALYSDVRPGDYRRQFDTRTQTESFEFRGSIVALKSQRHALTLTAAAGWSDVPRPTSTA